MRAGGNDRWKGRVVFLSALEDPFVVCPRREWSGKAGFRLESGLVGRTILLQRTR